jgi:hypothetical protein
MPTLGSVRGVAIDRPSTSFDVAVPRRQLEGRSRPERRRVMLVLRDSPRRVTLVLFNVSRQDGGPTVRQHVGTISWFGAFRHHGSQPEKGPCATTSPTSCGRRPGGTAPGTVVIEATHGRQAKDPAQAETQRRVASAAFRPAANLRIGAIELRAVPESPER